MPARHPKLVDAIRLSQSGRNAEALALLEEAAGESDAEALFLLGEIYWRGGMAPQDLPKARDFYRRAGDAGHSGGCANYTNLLAAGIAGPQDWPRTVDRLANEARVDPRRRAALAIIDAMQTTATGSPTAIPTGERLSEAADVFLHPALFSDAECDYLRQVAEPLYQRSMVQSGGRLVDDPIRTSDGASLQWLIEDPAIHALNRRLAAASGTPVENGEPLQILRYRGGQQYRPHLDALGTAPERVATALVYLNDDYQGGETVFGKLGITITPKKGQVLIFRNVDPAGQPDRATEHAGLPVTSDIKYLASRWIRAERWAL